MANQYSQGIVGRRVVGSSEDAPSILETVKATHPATPMDVRSVFAGDFAADMGATLGSDEEERLYLQQLSQVALTDVEGLAVARRAYGDSWRKRGGVGAFMMLARKWDRLETMLEKAPRQYDVLTVIEQEAAGAAKSGEAVLDAVRDLRRYLLLVETYVAASTKVQLPLQRDNVAADRIAAELK